MQWLVQDGRDHADADGDPNLRFYSVWRRAVEVFDPQVMFDPFKEQCHSSWRFVKWRDGQGRQSEVVGQENEPFFDLGVVIADASQRVGLIDG